MKKILGFSAVMLTLLSFAILTEKVTFARVTASAIDRDVWCVGVSGAEVCVDSSGNFIPTTTATNNLGTSSLAFKTLYVGSINGASTSGSSGAYTGTLDVGGNFTSGAAGYKSTNTASSGAWAFPATVRVGGASTLVGNVLMGTPSGAYVSTFTAASGNIDAGGAITSVGAITAGTTLSATTTSALKGNVYIGATSGAYLSTFTVASGNLDIGGAFTSIGAVTAGTSLKATAGAITFYPRTTAQICAIDPVIAGEVYYTTDSKALMVSTGTAVNQYARVDDPTLGCE